MKKLLIWLLALIAVVTGDEQLQIWLDDLEDVNDGS